MNVPTYMMVAVFLLLSQILTQTVQTRSQQSNADAIANDITQLAQAQARYATDPNNPNVGSYASSPSTLVAGGYLPLWSGGANYQFSFPTAEGFVVSFTASSKGNANRIANRFGKVARVVDTTTSVAYPSPLNLSLFDIFVNEEGDEMYGPLNMRIGSGADINMNDNNINSQGNATFKNGSGTANVDMDTGNAGSLTVQTFRVIN